MGVVTPYYQPWRVYEEIALDNLAIRQHDGLNVSSAPVH